MKIVEFVGLPGAGKTSIYNEINGFVEKQYFLSNMKLHNNGYNIKRMKTSNLIIFLLLFQIGCRMRTDYLSIEFMKQIYRMGGAYNAYQQTIHIKEEKVVLLEQGIF